MGIVLGVRPVFLLVDRLLPWALLVGLWVLFGPQTPYDGGDVVVLALIGLGSVGGWLGVHRLAERAARRRG